MLEDKKLPVTVYEKQRKFNLVNLLGQTLTDFLDLIFWPYNSLGEM